MNRLLLLHHLLLFLSIICLTQQLPPITLPGRVQFSFNKVPTIIEQAFWCGADGRNVVILTQQNHVYKSEDEGNTWKPIHPKLYEHGKRTAAREEQVGEVQWIKVSTTDPNILMFFGTQGVVWVSQDCGRTIKALYQGRRIEKFEFHPVQPRWGLASSINSCESQSHRSYSDQSDHFISSGPPDVEITRKRNCDIKRQLFYTTDLGDTWKLIADYVEQFQWAIVDNQHIKQGIPKTRILVVIDLNASGDQSFYGGWQRNLSLMQSDDFFESDPKTLVKHGNKFSKSKDFLYVATADRMGAETSLYVAQRRTKFQDFKKVKLPLEHLTEHSYTIIDTSENAAIIHVDHIGGQSKFGHLYISDVTGSSFSLSLQNNAREPTGICDIDRIWGLEGIYFANAIDLQTDQFFQEESSNRHGSMSQSSMYTSKPIYGFSNASNFARDQALSSSKKRMNQQFQEHNEARLGKMKKTYATFNKGGKWDLVTPPEQDSKGKSIKCKSSLGCSLHFHAVSTQSIIAPLYSYQSSPGLIIANGNIGPFLEMNPAITNTYLSRDGGKEWIEIAKGAHVYEFGNFGALIVMAPDMSPTKHIMYSWDEGMTWDYEVIGMSDIIVENIMIEPSASSQKFLVFGFMSDESQEGVIVHLDFTSMHQRACKGMFQSTVAAESDFEEWSPYDGRQGQKCLLGRHYTYTRRKRNSKCFIEGTLPSPRMMSCQCTDFDYECDEGYGRENVNSPCKLQQNLVQFQTQFLQDKDRESYSPEAVKKRQCESGSTYFVSQGYRKVAGNNCYGGLDRNPKMHSCSRFASGFSSTVILLLITIILLFVAFVYCGPPTAIIEFCRDKGSKYWDRAKQIIGGNDANNENNLGQYDRVGFAAVPDHYEADDDDDDDIDEEKVSIGQKRTPQKKQSKEGTEGEVAKDLLADDDDDNQDPLQL